MKTRWKVRTYALDHDIHTLHVANSPQTTLEFAKKNNRGNYRDIIKDQNVSHFADCANPAELKAGFERIGLVPRLEMATDWFAFWKPDDATYSTKYTPKRSGR